MKEKKCRVIKDYESSYTEPLLMSKGEILTFEEKECEWSGWIWCTNKVGESRWVPEEYLEIEGSNCKMVKDYNSKELNITVGEELIIHEEKADWYWVTNQNGKSGWVPIKNLKII